MLDPRLDTSGRRTRCTDGHRLVWPRWESAASMGRIQSNGAFGGVCTAGQWWSQNAAPLDYNSRPTRRLNSLPALRPADIPLLGGSISTTLRLQAEVTAYAERMKLACVSFTWATPDAEHVSWRDRYQDRRLYDDMDLSKFPERPHVESVAELQALVNRLIGEGWSFTSGVHCPTCVSEIKLMEADLEAAREEARPEPARES